MGVVSTASPSSAASSSINPHVDVLAVLVAVFHFEHHFVSSSLGLYGCAEAFATLPALSCAE